MQVLTTQNGEITRKKFREEVTAVTSEALSAGDFFNLYSNSGTLAARKADASAGYEAHGYVLTAYAAGETITGYRSGDNTSLSGLAPGDTYYLGTDGAVTSDIASVDYGVYQHVGVASSGTTLLTVIGEAHSSKAWFSDNADYSSQKTVLGGSPEDDNGLAEWTTSGTIVVTEWTTDDGAEGYYEEQAGTGGTISQDISVMSEDAGSYFCLSLSRTSYAGKDGNTFTFNFYDEFDSLLATKTTPETHVPSGQKSKSVIIGGTIPEDTTYVRVTITFVRNDGSNNNGAVREIQAHALGVLSLIIELFRVDGTLTAINSTRLPAEWGQLFPTHYERSSLSSSSHTTLTIPDNTAVTVNGTAFVITSDFSIDLSSVASWDDTTTTDYTTAANRAGKDFYIYACNNSGVLALLLSANATYPDGYDADTSRKIGGFHCLCADVGTITDHDLSGYVAGDILPTSIWDLKHRPVCSPEGMAYVEGIGKWADIYLASVNGAGDALVSANGGTIADGATSSPVFDWYDFNEWFGRIGKCLPTQAEFMALSDGSNQGTNIEGSTVPDPKTTGGHSDTAGQRMISNIGCEDCCGAMWQWLIETGGQYITATGTDQYVATRTSQRGQSYYWPTRGIAGGYWGAGADCGSRGSYWNNTPLILSVSVSTRGIADPI